MHDHRIEPSMSFAEAVYAPYRAALNVAEIVREYNTNYLITLAELTGDALQEPTPDTFFRNVQGLADERIKQSKAIGAVTAEVTGAYLDFFHAPFYLLRGD